MFTFTTPTKGRIIPENESFLRKSNVAAPNDHTGKRSEKPAVIEGKEMLFKCEDKDESLQERRLIILSRVLYNNDSSFGALHVGFSCVGDVDQ